MAYTSTGYIDARTGGIVANPIPQQWGTHATWSSMTKWAGNFENPMIYYTEPIDLGSVKYFNLKVEAEANGEIQYNVLTCNTASFSTIYDREPKPVTVNNGIVVSTSQYKTGTTSVAFDGVDDFYTTPSNSDFDFGTGPFTIEAWVKTTSQGLVPTREQYIYYKGTGTNALALWINGNYPTARFASGGLLIGSGGTAMNTSTWYHIAVSRDSGGVVRIFQDGYCLNTATVTTNLTNTYDVTFGRDDNGTSNSTSSYFSGYVDDLRVSNICRYTGNILTQAFTPPTTTLVNDTATVFLCTGEQGIADTPNIQETVTETLISNGDSNINAFHSRYVSVGIKVTSADRPEIKTSTVIPTSKRFDILLTDVDVTTLANSTTTSTSKVLDLGRETSAILAVFPQKSSGLDDVGIVPVVANKTEPAISFVKATEGAQDYVYGGTAGAAVDPASMTSPVVDVVVHVLPEQFMSDGVLQVR